VKSHSWGWQETANPSSANQKPPVMTGQSGGFTLFKLHNPKSTRLITSQKRVLELSAYAASPCWFFIVVPQTFAPKLHFSSFPSRTPAPLRLANPSLGVLKSVTGLDIYRFIAFISGCVSGMKPTTPSLFLKLRHLTSVTHLTF